jgi:hypothetical protein
LTSPPAERRGLPGRAWPPGRARPRRALTAAVTAAAVAAGAGPALALPGPVRGLGQVSPVTGLTGGLAGSGAGTAVGVLAILLAGANGFSKAYSP